jgi:hypothetical protein
MPPEGEPPSCADCLWYGECERLAELLGKKERKLDRLAECDKEAYESYARALMHGCAAGCDRFTLAPQF